ncbi:uncharacterized protein [Musca autumnalis]|uniref:uncharacterized protein n=1 Tax=Musca autumnalis TaxID=221902 RepID=UPI003CF93EB0
MVNVALLLQLENQTISLQIYYPFTAQKCHKPQTVVLNAKKPITNLNRNELYPKKFNNFHNCTLTAALWNVPPYLVLTKYGENFNDLEGMEGLLLKILAEVLQFRLNYKIPPNNEQRGHKNGKSHLRPNGTILNEHAADLSLGSFRCTLERSTALSPSATFYQTMQVFTVLALRHPFDSFEILTYPFDIYIWTLWILMTLGLLLLTIICEKLQKQSLYFLFGGQSTSSINIIAMALGQPVSNALQPQRNLARYFTTLWVVMAFLLRSSYQSSLFDFLNSDKTEKPPDTAAELAKRRYTLIVNMATADSFSAIPIIRNKLLKVMVMNISDTGGFPILEENPHKNYVTGTPRDFLVNYVNDDRKYGVFHVLKETIFSQQLCVYFSKHSYLVEYFDRIIQNLRSFGFIYHWAKQVFDDRFLEISAEERRPVALGFSQLWF